MDGPWALVEKEVDVEVPTDSLTVNFTQWKRRPKYVYVDDFLMRHTDTHVFARVGDEFYWNGRYFPVDKPEIWLKYEQVLEEKLNGGEGDGEEDAEVVGVNE